MALRAASRAAGLARSARALLGALGELPAATQAARTTPALLQRVAAYSAAAAEPAPIMDNSMFWCARAGGGGWAPVWACLQACHSGRPA